MYYNIGMDNLYNSASFCVGSFKPSKKVLVYDVARKGGCGIPKFVFQEDVKTGNDERLCCGTVNAALLCGEDGITCLFASSVYDTKPVHYLLMVSKNIWQY